MVVSVCLTLASLHLVAWLTNRATTCRPTSLKKRLNSGTCSSCAPKRKGSCSRIRRRALQRPLVLDRQRRLANEARAHGDYVLLHARGYRRQREAADNHHP